jgi:hypothetical protein
MANEVYWQHILSRLGRSFADGAVEYKMVSYSQTDFTMKFEIEQTVKAYGGKMTKTVYYFFNGDRFCTKLSEDAESAYIQELNGDTNFKKKLREAMLDGELPFIRSDDAILGADGDKTIKKDE